MIKLVNKTDKISIIDNDLMNFLGTENEMWLEIMEEDRENFTPEFQEKSRMFIRKVIINTELKLLHTEVD